jgi:glycosyltransferase involved in cell wall biosynthesis
LSQRHRITVISINSWWQKEKTNDEYLEFLLKNIDIHYVFSDLKLNPFLQELLAIQGLQKLERSLNLNAKSFDLSLSFGSVVSNYLFVKWLRIPSVFDLYDDFIGWVDITPWLPKAIKPFGKIVASFTIQRNIRISKKVTYTTPSLRKFYHVPENKAVLIPNGVDTNLFYFRHDTRIKDILNINDYFLIGFVGALEEWVNLELVLRALIKLKRIMKIKLLVVGGGSKFLEFKNLARSFGLQNDVIFTGNVPYYKVPEYISSMDVCLIPFDTTHVSMNALPIKLFEYMACERPVISTKLPGVQYVAGNNVLYASDEYELMQKILELYQNEELRNLLGKKGRNLVLEKFNWKSIATKLEKVLEDAVENE